MTGEMVNAPGSRAHVRLLGAMGVIYSRRRS